MKITSKKFKISYITDWITFNINDTSTTRAVRFKAVFSSTEPFNEINIGGTSFIPGLSVNDWFKKMLNFKSIGTDSNALEELRNLGVDVMLVKNTSPAYLLETFFNILKRLEPKLKSLEYVD